jgi:hypothetical protein
MLEQSILPPKSVISFPIPITKKQSIPQKSSEKYIAALSHLISMDDIILVVSSTTPPMNIVLVNGTTGCA